MPYQTLYRAFRPQSLEEVCGQQTVTRVLSRQLETCLLYTSVGVSSLEQVRALEEAGNVALTQAQIDGLRTME